MRWAVALIDASVSKKASKTPALLKRSKRPNDTIVALHGHKRSGPFPAYHRLGILPDDAMGFVPESRDANVERRPLGDRLGNIVAVVMGYERAFLVEGIAVIFRMFRQVLDRPIRHQFRQRRARLDQILADWKDV